MTVSIQQSFAEQAQATYLKEQGDQLLKLLQGNGVMESDIADDIARQGLLNRDQAFQTIPTGEYMLYLGQRAFETKHQLEAGTVERHIETAFSEARAAVAKEPAPVAATEYRPPVSAPAP